MTNLRKQVLKGVLFAIFAIPGGLLCVFSGICLIGSFSTPREKLPADPVVLMFLFLVGAFFALLGLGKIKQWLYVLVFVTMPISFWLYPLINPSLFGGLLPLLAVVAGSAFLTFRIVNNFYNKKQLN